MTSVDEMQASAETAPRPADEPGIQASGYLLELSLDWIVLRASENIHHLLGQSHVTLIDEPLSRFTQAQALHDLRNLFSRLSGTTGTARAYGVRLTDEHALFDVAFQLCDGRVILEAVPCSPGHFGEAFGTVGGLIAGLTGSGQALLGAAARRMRALTSYDRVTLLVGDSKATSDRTGVPFRSGANASLSDDLPAIVSNGGGQAIPIFPREADDAAVAAALLRSPTAEQKAELAERGFAATMRVPVRLDGEQIGEFRLAHTARRVPDFELHAAAELFAQMFAMKLQIERMASAG